MEPLTLSRDDVAVWTWLVSRGIDGVMSGLSRFVGQPVHLTTLEVDQLPAGDAAGLFRRPQGPLVGIYLSVEGDAAGHVVLAHEPEMLCRLADIQSGRPAGTTRTLEDIELPLVGEMGNVIGMHFLDALADAANLSFVPSPPAVLVDSAEAVLDLSLAGCRNGQEALVARTLAESSGQQVEGTFLVMPSSSFVRAILEGSRRQW